MTYESAEDYIRGEYGGEIPVIAGIIERVLASGDPSKLDRLALEIVGYYTGCLRADGTPRVKTRREAT